MTTDAPVAGADGGGLVVTVEATHDLSTDAVQEVRRLELRAEGSPRHVLQGGRDFRRLFFEVRAEQAEPHSEDALRIAALEFEETRQIAEALPVGDQFEDGAEEFRVASFAERSLLTRPLQLRGFRLLPLTEGKSAAGEASMLNLALDQLSFTAGVPLDQWADVSAASRPLVVFDFPRVFGASLESAIRKATGISERLLHLLALHRGAAGELFASVAQNVATEEVGWVHHEPHYGGNLLGGFLSGEDAEVLQAHLGAMEAEPLLTLWVSLYREALAEANPDFAIARFWNLLEVIAGNKVPVGHPVSEFDGSSVDHWTGRRGTTDSARGRVFQLLKVRSGPPRGRGENEFCEAGLSLWDTVGLCYALRIAAVHLGGFDPASEEQRSQRWFELVDAALGPQAEGGERTIPSLVAPLSVLRRTSETLIYGALDEGAGFVAFPPAIETPA